MPSQYQSNLVQQRPTSSAYRFPSSVRPKSSEFHSNCAPKEPVQAPAPTAKEGKGAVLVDVVVQDKLWKQAVHNETSATKQWEDNWGFMAEFDPKGRPKSAKHLPEKVNMFASSDVVPNTNSGNYGGRLNTDLGQTMQKLEFQFHSSNRKRKLGNEMVCY